jgi:hypothetical protein
MAIIDPVRLLQANPAENLSNLNAVDQADSLTDQSLMSFPDELMAAKQQQRDEDAAFEQSGQNPSDNPFILQNLPVNPSLAVAQPANIADSLANASGAAINKPYARESQPNPARSCAIHRCRRWINGATP